MVKLLQFQESLLSKVLSSKGIEEESRTTSSQAITTLKLNEMMGGERGFPDQIGQSRRMTGLERKGNLQVHDMQVTVNTR